MASGHREMEPWVASAPREKYSDSRWPSGHGLQRKGRLRTPVGVNPTLSLTSGPLPLELAWMEIKQPPLL